MEAENEYKSNNINYKLIRIKRCYLDDSSGNAIIWVDVDDIVIGDT